MLRFLLERVLTRAMKLLPEVEVTFDNLTKNDRKGAFPFNGRIALRDRNYQKIAHVEWNLLSRSARVGVRIEPSEGEVKAFAALPPIAVYVGLHNYRLARFFVPKGYAPRETSVSAHHGSVWWKVRADPTSWSSGTPRWRDGSWSVVDFLLGPETHRSEAVGEPEEIVVHLPEGAYRGRSTIERSTWERPRWFAKTKLRADVTFDPRFGYAPIPTPGKGENSYDCDEDALYSTGCMARTHEEAIGEVVKSVLSRRRRYGGTNWRPEGGPHGSGGAKGGGGTGTDDEPLAASGEDLDAYVRKFGVKRLANESDPVLRRRVAFQVLTLTPERLKRINALFADDGGTPAEEFETATGDELYTIAADCGIGFGVHEPASVIRERIRRKRAGEPIPPGEPAFDELRMQRNGGFPVGRNWPN